MARIRSTAGASENSIVFFPAGGHSHDGQNSSLIDTAAYSLYDFSPTFSQTANPERSNRQQNNKVAIDDLIIRTVNNMVLEPAGIRLTPGTLNGQAIIANTITANEIAANTITANNIATGTITGVQISNNSISNSQIANATITATELAASLVLVNNTIQSSVYTQGVAGWRISNTGVAEFNNVTVRGAVAATSGNIAGWTINSSNISGGSTVLHSNGYISAATGSFTGTISANSGNIAGWTINSANITGGNTILYSNGYISVSNGSFSGSISANSGSVGSWTIGSTTISAGSTTLYSNGTGAFGNTTLYSNGRITNGNFSVSADGNLTAISGSVGGWGLASDRLTITNAYGENSISPTNGIFLRNAWADLASESYLTAGRLFIRWGEGSNTTITGSTVDTITVFADYFLEASDARLKENKTKILNSIEVIKQFEPLQYNFIGKEEIRYGLIAQDLYSVAPYAVSAGGDDPQKNPWRIDYAKLIPVLISSIKEILEKIENLENRLNLIEQV